MKKILGMFCGAMILGSCGSFPEAPEPLATRSPQVLSWLPAPTEPLDLQPEVEIVFSEPVDPITVGSDSVILAPTPTGPTSYENVPELLKAIDKKIIETVPLSYQLEMDCQTLHLGVETPLQAGMTYFLMVTPRVLSQTHVPFDESGEGWMEPFSATYQTQVSSDLSSGNGSFGEPAVSEMLPAWDHIVINEIYYDVPGEDTDGQVFIELFGPAGALVGSLLVQIVNGADGKILKTLTLPVEGKLDESGYYVIADAKKGDTVDTQVIGANLTLNFDPQNGPDTIRLMSPDGGLLDVVGYGDFQVGEGGDGLPLYEGQASGQVAAGHSLERQEAGLDTGNNQDDFIDRDVPTPGFRGAPEISSPPAPAESTNSIPETRPAEKVVLNEIYYDAVGSDTDGQIFIELFGTPEMSLARYQVNLINGDDGKIYDFLNLPEEAVVPADGFYLIADSKTGFPAESFVFSPDWIDNFDPQNGPDAIQLVDATGELADVVGYGDGIVSSAGNDLASFEGTPIFDVINGHSLERKNPGFDTGNNRDDFIERDIPTPRY